MNGRQKYLYEFGSFQLDPVEHILLCDGKEISLTPKVFDTLAILVENHGHVVDKDSLMDSVWKDAFVDESNLVKNVSILRKVFSENDGNLQYIETFPKRGYRFVAPVKEVKVGESSDTVPEPDLVQKKTKSKIAIIASVLIISVLTAGVYFYSKTISATPLTDRDVILLTDFENKTGDILFDGTLKTGLLLQLRQSPFLSIFSEARARKTLELMKRSRDANITKKIGREICQRQGLKAYVVGTIAKFGTKYALTLEAFNSQTDESIALAQVEAESEETVLKSLSDATSDLRKQLGESLTTVEKFDKPLEATTSSLRALKAYSDAVELVADGKEEEALRYFQQAVALDHNFAMAYLRLSGNYSSLVRYKLAAEALQKAFELREHASEREKVLIESSYYFFIQRDIKRSIEILKIAKRNYPRDAVIRAFRTHYYLRLGKLEEAFKEYEETIRIMNEVKTADVEFQSSSFSINPNFQMGIIKVMRGETGKAKEFFNKSGVRNSNVCLGWLFAISFMEGNERELDELKKLNRDRDGVCNTFLLQAKAASFKGKRKSTEEFYKKAVDFAQKKNNPARATLSSVALSSAAVEFGDCSNTETLENTPVDYYVSVFPLTFSPLALARCGKLAEAENQINKLKEKYPNGTLENGIWIPMFKAQIELEKGNPKAAIGLLENAKEYEWAYGARFYPQYILAQAYRKLGENENAKIEFQKILDNRGRAPLDGLYPLAQLGKARVTKDKREYEKFFEYWKDADEDLEILIEAKKEYENLN